MQFVALFARKDGKGEWCFLSSFEPNPSMNDAEARADRALSAWQHNMPRDEFRVAKLEGSTCDIWKAKGWPQAADRESAA